ncbi:FISUMP domain-containing protein [Bacteroidota bacterium]
MSQPKSLFMLVICTLLFSKILYAQEVVGTVIDYDGNIYTEIQIGNQVWLKENIKSLHYSDGTPIPGVVCYDDDPANADIYGRLYTWQAAMRNSIQEGAQGIAPDGYHIASDTEWNELENYLGGSGVAGGKMKEAGTAHWISPNAGADNSSGFTALPAGEYDAHYTPNIYQFLNTGAIFWTSTNVTVTKAREKYLTHDSGACRIYDWYKTMKYSVRCIKNTATNIDDNNNRIPADYKLGQNYPNPFNPSTVIPYTLSETGFVTIEVYDILGRKISSLVNEVKSAGNHYVNFDASNLPAGRQGLSSGLYLYRISVNGFISSKKMQLVR